MHAKDTGSFACPKSYAEFFSFILCIGMVIGNSSSLIYVNTQFSGDIQVLL